MILSRYSNKALYIKQSIQQTNLFITLYYYHYNVIIQSALFSYLLLILLFSRLSQNISVYSAAYFPKDQLVQSGCSCNHVPMNIGPLAFFMRSQWCAFDFEFSSCMPLFTVMVYRLIQRYITALLQRESAFQIAIHIIIICSQLFQSDLFQDLLHPSFSMQPV